MDGALSPFPLGRGKQVRKEKTMKHKPLFDEADIVSCYTRADAIGDGVLVDLSKLAAEAGITFPTAITQSAWHAAIEPPADCPEQSEDGRAWDVLNVLRFEALRNGQATRLDFAVRVRRNARQSEDVFLKSLVHPGDEGEGVITIMLPDED